MTTEIPHECKFPAWRTQDSTWQCPVCGTKYIWSSSWRTVPGVPADVATVRSNSWVTFDGLEDCFVIIYNLKRERLDRNIHWILPKDFLPGVQLLWGYPVVRAEIPRPMIGIRP